MMGLRGFLGMIALAGISQAATAQAPAPPAAPPGPLPAPARGPSLAASLDAARTAIATCSGNGYKVAVSVVDSAGVLKVLLASDGAPARVVEYSKMKAATALAMNMPTSEVADKAKTDRALAARLAADPTLFAHAGGLLLKAGDSVIGAIAVSGAPEGDKDEACASAAIAKVKAELK